MLVDIREVFFNLLFISKFGFYVSILFGMDGIFSKRLWNEGGKGIS